MSDKAKHIDIDDFGNTENVIKRVLPEFSDITARLPGAVSNFAQQKLSLTVNRGGRAELPPLQERGHPMFLKMKKERDNG